jgi:hypothetical protein
MTAVKRRRKRGRFWFPLVTAIAAGAVGLSLLYPRPDGSEGTGDDAGVRQFPDSVCTVPDSVTILVLNGAGIPDLARTVQRYLTRQGTRCLFRAPGDPGNADRTNYETTIIVSHRQDVSGALAVAGELGLPDSAVVWQIPGEGEPDVDVTVYLGRDMSGRSFPPYSN